MEQIWGSKVRIPRFRLFVGFFGVEERLAFCLQSTMWHEHDQANQLLGTWPQNHKSFDDDNSKVHPIVGL